MLKWIVKTHSKRFLCALLIGSFCPSIGLAQALAAKPICEVIAAAAAAAATPAEQRETVLTLKLAPSAEAVTWFEKWKTGEIFLGEGGMSLYFAAAIPVSFLVAALVGILLERSVMQNRNMAACMGVRTEVVNTITFAFGCGQAGLAGAFLSQIGNVGPSMGQFYIVDSFMTVVVGGAGNILGTVISALGIGRKFQTPTVYNDLTVTENLVISLSGSRGIWHSLFGKITTQQKDRIAEILKIIKLSDRANRKAGILAHGQKQWLETGMLLAQEARLLLVDEPAAGMTDEETYRTGELLLSLAGKHTIIVIEHDMTFVRQISQGRKVTVLHQGHVLCGGPVDQVQSDERVIKVYLGRISKAA